MAPDRGDTVASQTLEAYEEDGLPKGRSFTARGVLVGVLVGLVICFSNMYFGLQTGWVSSMTMPASLMGFGIFRALQPHLKYPFSPVENVLVQTVAGSMGIMPLGCGFVGVIPAMNYLLTTAEQGPLAISTWKLVLWSLGLCYFGVVFAVPLRRQVIIREKLRFPSGYSTAILIGVLHGQTQAHAHRREDDHSVTEGFASLVSSRQHSYSVLSTENARNSQGQVECDRSETEGGKPQHWIQNMRLLTLSFATSGTLTIATYFLPVIRNLPIFGLTAAETWLWTLNPSLAYVGQGVIMGTETTLHMLFGAVIGWAFLSPLAHYRGWAPGPVDDWEHGSKGWIVWVSLAIMLADALVSLLYIAIRSLWTLLPSGGVRWVRDLCNLGHPTRLSASERTNIVYQPIVATPEDPMSPSTAEGGISPMNASMPQEADGEVHDNWENGGDAPASQQVGWAIICVGLVLSILLCVVTTKVVFGQHIPLSTTITAVLVALLLSILGVRALGETDLNPVSGISKLAQLFFAVLNPQTGKSSIVLNLVAGAVSEAGALQAGDLMQDLKTGHLLGAAPNAQFWGQVIGATLGAIASALIYTLYTSVYQVPGELFQIPTSYVWVFTARLVTGKGLPPMAREWATWAGLAFAITTLLRSLSVGRRWRRWIPGGVAVAVGMYNTPSFTLARAIGGALCWIWRSKTQMPETSLVVMASGLILGEGFLSIANLILQSFGVPHW